MKTLLTILIPFLLTGCYTQLKVAYPYDYEFSSNQGDYYDQYGDDSNQDFEEGYEYGYQDGVQVFRDQQIANRWSNYYNRFYWVDPFWGGSNYDAFLWDPYYGYYGTWGVSYYGYYSNNFSVFPNYGWGIGYGWSNRWNYPPNVIFVGNHFNPNQTEKNTRWAYGPRDFGNGNSGSTRGSMRSSDPYAKASYGSRKSISSGNSPRKSNSGYSIPVKKPSGSSNSGSVARPSKSSGSSSGSSSKKSDNSSSSSTKSSSSSSKSSARPSRSGNN